MLTPNFGLNLLPPAELAEALRSPDADELFIAALASRRDKTLLLHRGNLASVVIPFSWFRSRRGGPAPDFSDPQVTDFGRTIRLGDYEAASDAILYEFAPDVRRKLKARIIRQDRTFGGSIRRLRLQKGLSREDVPGVTARTLTRIETGRTRKPGAATLQALADSLGVGVGELGSF